MRCVWLLFALGCGARSELGSYVRGDGSPPPPPPPPLHDAGPEADAPDEADAVASCPDAPTPLLLASGIKATESSYDTRLGQDSDYLYMGDGTHVVRVSKCTPGDPVRLTGLESNAARVLADEGVVYFVDIVTSGGIRRVPVAGGATTTVANADYTTQPLDLQKTGGTLVYLVESILTNGPDTIWSVPANGGVPSRVSALGGAIGSRIAADGTNVYYFAQIGAGTMLVSQPLAGGSVTKLADSGSDGAIAVDDTNVYYSGDTTLPFLSAVPKGGGAVTVLWQGASQSGPSHPDAIVVDAGYVYFWTSSISASSVFRVPSTGGTVAAVASDGFGIVAVTLDAASLYHLSGDGHVYRVDKP